MFSTFFHFFCILRFHFQMADTVIEVDDHPVRSVNIADELIEYLVNTSSTNAINKIFIVLYINGR